MGRRSENTGNAGNTMRWRVGRCGGDGEEFFFDHLVNHSGYGFPIFGGDVLPVLDQAAQVMDPGSDIRVFFGAVQQGELQFFDRAIPVVVVEMTIFVHSAVGGQKVFLDADDTGIIRGGDLIDFFTFA